MNKLEKESYFNSFKFSKHIITIIAKCIDMDFIVDKHSKLDYIILEFETENKEPLKIITNDDIIIDFEKRIPKNKTYTLQIFSGHRQNPTYFDITIQDIDQNNDPTHILSGNLYHNPQQMINSNDFDLKSTYINRLFEPKPIPTHDDLKQIKKERLLTKFLE